MAYNRYTDFTVDGIVKPIPFIRLTSKTSDKHEIYKKGITRFDNLSNKFYKDSNYGWLILQANPNLNSLEFEIEDGIDIIIPFPLETSIKDYKEGLAKYIKYYGV